MKRTLLILFTSLLTLNLAAQPQQGMQGKQMPKFSPEMFEAQLHQFITREACLTPKEAAKFFPVYKEMQDKQRALYGRQRQMGRIKPANDEGCEKAIRQRDEIELELKRIQQKYHDRFLRIISASKLYDVIQAEDRFHRQAFRGWSHGNWNHAPKWPTTPTTPTKK
jgi:hypothetical protein